MNPPTMNFMDLCLAGETLASDINDYIDAWHESKDNGQSIAEFLGMTQSEYALWVEKPSSLKLIIFSRHSGASIENLLRFDKGHAMAARASSTEEVEVLVNWLKATKRIP
jgi:hypothetical protein